MKSLTIAIACLGLLGTMIVPRAKADEYNQKTTVSFSEPVEIPGRVLPAGTYVFQLLDSQSDRNIVQIFNKNQTHLYATILAIPDMRLRPTGKTVVTFEERAAGAPEAVKAWFYPGDAYGQEFVYPKARAVQLAKASHQNVPSMPSEMAANITKPAKSAQEPHVQQMAKAPLKAQTPSGGETEIAQAVTPPPPKPPAAAPTQMARNLPHTASPLPLIGLLGLLAMGGGFTLRRIAAGRIS
jgi:hypothetical protein